MLRVKDLQSALTEAKAQIKSLTTEIRTLKTMEKRQEVALSKYEGTHARLPQVIRSFSEDIRTLQTQLRCSKASYRQLEDRHRNQSAELAAVQKKYKHLLDLTKNKQLSDREKLSHQLEVAENTVKEQEKKIQTLLQKLESQDKSHRYQMNVEISKIEQLQMELNRKTKENDELKSNIEKLKYQSYGGRSSNSLISRPNKRSSIQARQSKSKLSGVDGDGIGGFGDLGTASLDSGIKLSKSELVHDESNVCDNTRDLQKNLMLQVHEDVIKRSNMLVGDNIDTSDTTKSWLKREISDLVKEKDSCDDFDDSGFEVQAEPVTTAVNPFSLTNTDLLTTRKKTFSTKKDVSDSSIKFSEEKNLASKSLLKKPANAHNDDDDDDTGSSLILLSDSDGDVD